MPSLLCPWDRKHCLELGAFCTSAALSICHFFCFSQNEPGDICSIYGWLSVGDNTALAVTHQGECGSPPWGMWATTSCWHQWDICHHLILWILDSVRKSDVHVSPHYLIQLMWLVSFMWSLFMYPSFHFSLLLEWNWTQPSSCLHPYVRSKYFTFNLHPLGFRPSFTTCCLFPAPYSYIHSSKANSECSVGV